MWREWYGAFYEGLHGDLLVILEGVSHYENNAMHTVSLFIQLLDSSFLQCWVPLRYLRKITT